MEETLPKLLRKVALDFPETIAQFSKNKSLVFEGTSYRSLYAISLDLAAALHLHGVSRGMTVGLISDNRKEWQQIDMAIMALGAIDVPRGCDATANDLKYILSFSECTITIAENDSQAKKILSVKADLPQLKTIVVFDDASDETKTNAHNAGIEVLRFQDLLQEGTVYNASHHGEMEAELLKGKRDDTCCIIFTSGTTGKPKGVELCHKNFLVQLDELQERIFMNPGDKALCVLPIWHVFQRECEYVIMIQAGSICYSKPIGSILLADFKKINPHMLPAVPRVFEAVYDGIHSKMRKTGGIVFWLFTFFTNCALWKSRFARKLFRKNARFGADFIFLKWLVFFLPWLFLQPFYFLGNLLIFIKIKSMLGKNFRAGIAGGGAYPKNIDEFFWSIGVNIVEGYGLTETAPVISVRPIADPIFGTVGSPIRGVKVRIVDENGNVLPRCKQGVVQVKGDTVMKGYFKRDDLTEKVFTSDGWFDTGDVGILTIHDELILKGRMKDTIVLRGGENVEPLPIEQKLQESRFIKTAVVVGQDERFLGALIVVNNDEVKNHAKENGIEYDTYENFLASEYMQTLFTSEINNLVNAKNGFKMFERINRFFLLTNEFENGKELSAKQEIMRFKINELYKKEIQSMFAQE